VAENSNLIDKYVGSRVRMRRMMLDLTQTEVAQAVGVTFQQLQKYEKGDNRISASRLQLLSDVLQAPIAFFFEGLSDPARSTKRTTRPSISQELAGFLGTSDAVRFIKASVQIKNRRLRQTITQLIEDLSNRRRSRHDASACSDNAARRSVGLTNALNRRIAELLRQPVLPV
jgi:transcriptional regulator with XRE-family HTH domain